MLQTRKAILARFAGNVKLAVAYCHDMADGTKSPQTRLEYLGHARAIVVMSEAEKAVAASA